MSDEVPSPWRAVREGEELRLVRRWSGDVSSAVVVTGGALFCAAMVVRALAALDPGAGVFFSVLLALFGHQARRLVGGAINRTTIVCSKRTLTARTHPIALLKPVQLEAQQIRQVGVVEYTATVGRGSVQRFALIVEATTGERHLLHRDEPTREVLQAIEKAIETDLGVADDPAYFEDRGPDALPARATSLEGVLAADSSERLIGDMVVVVPASRSAQDSPYRASGHRAPRPIEAHYVAGRTAVGIALSLVFTAIFLVGPLAIFVALWGGDDNAWSSPWARQGVMAFLVLVMLFAGLPIGLSLADYVGRVRRPLALRASSEGLYFEGRNHPLERIDAFSVASQTFKSSTTHEVVVELDDGTKHRVAQGLAHEVDAAWLREVLERWRDAARARD